MLIGRGAIVWMHVLDAVRCPLCCLLLTDFASSLALLPLMAFARAQALCALAQGLFRRTLEQEETLSPALGRGEEGHIPPHGSGDVTSRSKSFSVQMML